MTLHIHSYSQAGILTILTIVYCSCKCCVNSDDGVAVK